MSVTFGPTTWWLKSKESADYYAASCPVGTILGDGSAIWCKTQNYVWLVAPFNTESTSSWSSGKYNTTAVGDKCCICEWTGLYNNLISNGFNPCDWIVPDQTILTDSYSYKNFWDNSSSNCYWSSTEFSSTNSCGVDFTNGNQQNFLKTSNFSVRAFRCVSL